MVQTEALGLEPAGFSVAQAAPKGSETVKRLMMMSMCAGALLAGASALLPAGEPGKGQPAMPPEMQKAMERMEAYGALNENHGYLKQFEGEWECVMKCWMSADLPPEENACTVNAKVGYDGKFLIEKFQGTVAFGEGAPPQPFNGLSIIGYDNHRRQFVSTWIDNFTTGVYTLYGSASQGGKVFTFEGENYCCMNDKMVQTRSVLTIKDPNTRTFEMWSPGIDGKVIKSMEATYTRKK